MAVSKFFLVSMDKLHPPIVIKDISTIGRSRQTGITDTCLSRNQVLVELIGNCIEESHVEVKFIGKHYSLLNGEKIEKGKSYSMKIGDVLHLMKGKYGYKLCSKSSIGKTGSKRSLESNSDEYTNEQFVKKMKLDSEETTEFSKNSSDEVNDDEHIECVENKLAKLKQSFEFKPSFNNDTNKKNESLSSGTSTKEKLKPIDTWQEECRLLIFQSEGLFSSDKIASFDLDGTIIITQSGKVFPTNTSDWKLLFPGVPERLKELKKNGYKIVIFSNQMGLSKGKVSISDFKSKVENIVLKLGVAVQVFIATGPGLYRKPCSGMWGRLIQEENDGIEIDMKSSFYVGDAAGRPKDWQPGKKKDFSCGDRLFALNIGLKFETPDEFFLKQRPAKYELPSFDPKSIDPCAPILKDPNSKLASDKQELIVMVGYPAAGKSHFVREHLSTMGYFHVNRDTLGSWQKCLQKAQEALKSGRSVAIDNTNPDKESRKRYISLAKDMKVDCRCFIMSLPLEHSRHNEKFREMTDKQHQTINEMIFNSYKSKYEEPDLSEGFSEVVHINFIPTFSNANDKRLYQQYLLEK